MVWLLSLEADPMLRACLCVCVCVCVVYVCCISWRSVAGGEVGLSASPKPVVRYSGVGALLAAPKPDLLVFSGGDYRA